MLFSYRPYQKGQKSVNPTVKRTLRYLSGVFVLWIFVTSDHVHLPLLPPKELTKENALHSGKRETALPSPQTSIAEAPYRFESFRNSHYTPNHEATVGLYFNPAATCPPNVDFEYGNFSNWQTNIGTVLNSTPTENFITYLLPNWLQGNNIPDRHMLMDRQANPLVDKYGNFPVNPPDGGGRYALKLGNDQNDPNSSDSMPNGLAEAVRYVIKVPDPADHFAIVFSYAVVFENPSHPNNIHTYTQQPRFMARMYEPGGDTLKCANLTFVASDPLPGFDTSTIYKIDSSKFRYPGGVNFAIVKYKKWSRVFVDLSDYPGKTFYLEFATTDCTKRGHFGYAYVDVMECNNPTDAYNNCKSPIRSFLTAPPGFESYQWWNKDFSKILGTSDTLIIDPPFTKDDEIHVKVIPYDRFGCVDTFTTNLRVPNIPVPGIRYQVVNTLPNINTPLTARAIGTTFQWEPAIGLNDPKSRTPVYKYDKNIEYLIKIGRDPDCMTVDTVEVRVINKADVWVPRGFSPNNDGHNDYLDVFTKNIREINFWVFNRWGQLMFQTKDIRQRWDGKFNGRNQPLETYVWVAEAISNEGERVTRRGQTVLIR